MHLLALILKLQIIRKGTGYEGYRLTIPKAVVHAHNLRDKDFKLEVKGEKIILTPVRKRISS